MMDTVSRYITNKDFESLSEYVTDLVYQFNKNDKFKYDSIFSQLKDIHIDEFKGLVAAKLISAMTLGIKVDTEIHGIIDSLEIDILDLARITGILLDNAIEESKKIEGSTIKFAASKEHGIVKILIANQLENTNLDLSKIYERNYTTKGKGHGIGLYTVKSLISKYDNITSDTRINDNWFIQEIAFYPNYDAGVSK